MIAAAAAVIGLLGNRSSSASEQQKQPSSIGNWSGFQLTVERIACFNMKTITSTTSSREASQVLTMNWIYQRLGLVCSRRLSFPVA